MPSDLTLINLNMLFMRYGEQIERERHVPLGCLYLTRALEAAGITVDFRDYQLWEAEDPFDLEAFLTFAADPAPVAERDLRMPGRGAGEPEHRARDALGMLGARRSGIR